MKNELRVIIAGSRDFTDYRLLEEKCSTIIMGELIKNEDRELQKIRIISGTARGADKLGERFAKNKRYKLSRFPADWGLYGKSGGYIRNVEMAEFSMKDNNVGVLIAFWDEKSKGTKNMIDIAKRYGLKVHVIKF